MTVSIDDLIAELRAKWHVTTGDWRSQENLTNMRRCQELIQLLGDQHNLSDMQILLAIQSSETIHASEDQ